MCHKLRSIYKKQPHHVKKKNQLHSHFSCINFQHTSSTILHATQHCWNLDTIFIDTLVCMDSPMFLKLFIQKHFKINTFKSTKTMCCLSNFFILSWKQTCTLVNCRIFSELTLTHQMQTLISWVEARLGQTLTFQPSILMLYTNFLCFK